MNDYPGLFISFEGGDGAGKSTQVGLLAAALRARGYEVVITREPGGTELGVRIRELLLSGGEVSPRAEALLFAADRAQHVAALVRPALARGAVVISDRYLDSSLAYQGGARDLDVADVRKISLWATAGLLPQLTVLLDVPVAAGLARVGAQQDRMEAAGTAFHERVRAEFLALAAREPQRFLVLNGRDEVPDIAAQVLVAVARLLAGAAELVQRAEDDRADDGTESDSADGERPELAAKRAVHAQNPEEKP